MSTEAEAKAAIEKLDNKEVNGRAITVNEARPQKPRSFSGSNFHANKSESSY